jgi:hypothetical protein
MQFFERHTLDTRRVEEQVFSATDVNEPETPVRQPLDAAFSHLHVSRRDYLNRRHLAYDCRQAGIR